MLERKRLARHYHMVAGSDEEEPADLELGEQLGSSSQHPPPATTIESELDNWDEHAGDAWEEDADEHAEVTTTEESVGDKTPDSGSFGDVGTATAEPGDDGGIKDKRLY
jgi:hypothetical protein